MGPSSNSTFTNLVNQIYDAPLCEEGWTGLLDRMADFSGTDVASLLIVQPRFNAANVLSPRSDPEFLRSYFSDWMMHDPTFAYTTSRPVGFVQTLTQQQREALRKSAFAHDFWFSGGQGIERLRTNVVANPDQIIGFCFHQNANRDEITDELRERYLLLLSHVMRSMDMQDRLQRLELRIASGQDAICEGLLALDFQGRIIVADERAEKIISRNRWLVSRHGVLNGYKRADTDRLARAIRACWSANEGLQPRGGEFKLSGPLGGSVNIRIGAPPGQMPRFAADFAEGSRVAALAVIEDSREQEAAAIETLRNRFNLTPSEVIVARECLKGGSRAQVANALRLSESTVRTHLTRIYHKTGTTRRPALIRLLSEHGIAQ